MDIALRLGVYGGGEVGGVSWLTKVKNVISDPSAHLFGWAIVI